VAALAVVEDLEVLEDGVGQLDSGPPAFPVEDLDLESRPEGLDYGVVETVADRAHRWQQSRLAGSPGERPGHELHSLVRVDDQPGVGFGLPVRDGHPERIGDQCRSLSRVDRPADNNGHPPHRNTQGQQRAVHTTPSADGTVAVKLVLSGDQLTRNSILIELNLHHHLHA
tara:strand:+ start:183 stop:692 length:510 start_codon:yes stop_codon:yes gene_type:complete